MLNRAFITLLLAAALLAAGANVFADDRNLLRESSSDPYVFFLFDTSGSMHWSPQCSLEDFNNGVCDFLCPSGDCFVPRNGDDPSSKFRQAKEALYEVIEDVGDGLQFGFATFNQNRLRMHDKHWLYRWSDTKPDGTNNVLTLRNAVGQIDDFPDGLAHHCTLSGATCDTDADCGARGGVCAYEEVFGATWDCDQSGAYERDDNDTRRNLARKACYGSTSHVADMDDYWELRRAQRLPKLGRGPDFPGAPRDATFIDRFSTASYGNNDGNTNWAGNWIEQNDSGGATGGNALISGGRLSLDDSPNNRGRPNVRRVANLSNYVSAELSFDFEIAGDVESSDQVVVEIRSGGGWDTLDVFDGNNGGVKTGSRSYDISDWIDNDTEIRFRISDQYQGSDEQFIIDNVVIEAQPDGETVYLRHPDDTRYKLIYRPLELFPDGTTNRYGNPQLAVDVEVRRCTNNADDCSSVAVDRQTIYYDLVGQFSSWDNGVDRGPRSPGFYTQGTAGDGDAINTCRGWDGNDDTDSDRYPNDTGYDLRWPNEPVAPGRFDLDGDGTFETPDFQIGDLIQFDWKTDKDGDGENDNKLRILGRLAPNVALDSDATPEFTIASYFSDRRSSGENFLRLANEVSRPMIAEGSTPLGGSLDDFRAWYNGCNADGCSGTGGWEAIAELYDRDFNCRKKFLIVLTDGDNTCNGASPCDGAGDLRQETGIKTYVIAFGVEGGTGNALQCMADEGGTGEPIYPQNKAQLVDALTDIFNDIKVEARAFSSASVPTLTNETSDKIILSTFTPLPNRSIWPGRVDTFRSPLPLLADGKPNKDRKCGTGNPPLQAACHLWDAGEVLLTQAPTEAQLAADDYRMGDGENRRRVLYRNEKTGTMRLFVPPEEDSDEEKDLWEGFGFDVDLSDTTSVTDARTRTKQIIDNILKIKDIVPPPDSGRDTYVLGDIFHSEPQVVSSPNNLTYFRQDLNGYRAFVDENLWRRKMLVVGANDGQLHFFDAGVRTKVRDPALDVDVERFTDGTGKELFSYIPRNVLPVVRDQAESENHVYSLDGVPVQGDVFFPDEGWRTIVVSGLREAGDIFRRADSVPDFVSGYFALDVTQPDPLIESATGAMIPVPESGDGSPPIVPGCLKLAGDDLAGNSDCAPDTFANELWIFRDSIFEDVDGDGVDEEFFLDEEPSTGNGEFDLGETWSKPVIGRIRVDDEDRFVAIFGGGIASEDTDANTPKRGAWLYMVDVRTGEALYKRRLDSSVPAAPAVIDREQDGIFDLIYVATTAGTIYKVDLSSPVTLAAPAVTVDNLIPADPSKGLPSTFDVPLRVTDSDWEPFPIFSTGGRPIYMTPSAFLVPDLGQFAIAVGTGNRNDLWTFPGVEGRFYVFVDEDYADDSTGLPRTETDYVQVQPDSANNGLALLSEDRALGSRGWYMVLNEDERIITQAVVVVGVLIFTAFDPQETVLVDDEGEVDACARSGASRIFVVDAENGDSFLVTDDDEPLRYHTESSFTTAPYVKETTTKNPDVTGDTTESRLDTRQEALQEAIRRSLMKYFPKGCRYNRSFSFTVDASLQDTGHVRYATIPIAMCPVEWREE